jgi:F-type H+-transporting ATPase subunit delta
MARVSAIARRYGQAYFELARDAGDIEGWRKELAGVVEVLSNTEVAQAVQNPKLPLSQRVRLTLDLLDGASKPARNLARLLVERRRTSLLPEMLAHYDQLADRASGVLRAEIITAVPIDERLERAISEALSKRLGASVSATVQQDPSIIGGLVIRVGDHVIDDSIRTHLQQLQAALA